MTADSREETLRPMDFSLAHVVMEGPFKSPFVDYREVPYHPRSATLHPAFQQGPAQAQSPSLDTHARHTRKVPGFLSPRKYQTS